MGMGPRRIFEFKNGDPSPKKSDYQQAKTYFQKSLAEYEKQRNPSPALYYLVLTNSELELMEEAKEYLHRLEQIGKDTEDRMIHQQCLIAKGIIFKKSPRAINKGKAQEIFQQITEEEIIDHDLTVFAILNLLEILIWELSSTGHEEVLQEIQELITQLNEIAQKHQSSTLEIEVALIQSQLELIQGNVNQSITLLDHPKTIALENNLESHQVRIKSQLRVIETEFQKWIELTDQNVPMIERMRQSNLLDYIAEAQRFLDKGASQEERTQQHMKLN
jgi:tetratricopeptide (TPR) repeat protein